MITNLTIFTSAICNLNCTYCYVKKDNSLLEYDESVVESIKNNEYISRFQSDFPESVNSLTTLEFWGAEPSVHLDLVADKLEDYKKAFPNLTNINMSSNYTLPNFIDNVTELLDAMGKIKNTNWKFHLQCSIDGSKSITDTNRGQGTTDKIINNLNLLKKLSIPDNVCLTVANKSTISKEQFDELSNYESVKDYMEYLQNILSFTGKNKSFWATAPTCVEPYYYNKADGVKFSKVIENFITLSKETNKLCIPYVRNRKIILSEYMRGGFCGQCEQCVTMLPNNKYVSCHRCGFDIIPKHYEIRTAEYKELLDRELSSPTDWLKDISGYKKLEYNMNTFYNTKAKTFFSQFYNTSKILLDIGEISSIYYNDEILRRHIMLFMNITKCSQTNKELTGSYFCSSSFFMPLFFNGAIQKIYDFLEDKKLI